MTKIQKLMLGAAMAAFTLTLTASAHAQAVDATFITSVATTSIASVVTIWTATLPVILPFMIATGVLFALIFMIRRRSRPH